MNRLIGAGVGLLLVGGATACSGESGETDPGMLGPQPAAVEQVEIGIEDIAFTTAHVEVPGGGEPFELVIDNADDVEHEIVLRIGAAALEEHDHSEHHGAEAETTTTTDPSEDSMVLEGVVPANSQTTIEVSEAASTLITVLGSANLICVTDGHDMEAHVMPAA